MSDVILSLFAGLLLAQLFIIERRLNTILKELRKK